MLKQIKKSKQGFTIIEVLIVLAIAALILLVVLLAVPSLQRSQRNNARKSDAARFAASIVDYVSNNNGSLPATQANCNTVKDNSAKLSQYDNMTCNATIAAAFPAAVTASNIYIATNSGTKTNASMPAPTTNVMVMSEQSKCADIDPSTNFLEAGGGRQLALAYTLETSNGWQWSCVNAQ